MYQGFLPLTAGLPVFMRPEEESALYYAPGLVLRAHSSALPEAEKQILSGAPRSPLLAELAHRARAAQARWDGQLSQPYEPVCLTVYLENRCNLACSYCYADPAAPAAGGPAPVRLGAVRSAAGLAAENCRRQGLPFTAVFHGGGEPSLNPRLLEAALAAVEEAAARAQVPVFKYLATNGVMPESRARWIASRFNLIGLSCDGPEEIQRAQRPLPHAQKGGRSSTRYVERTARTLREHGAAFHVRVTLTPDTITRQVEIVDYVCSQLAPQEIHFEPVYTGGREQNGFVSPEPVRMDGLADTFVRHFLAAQARARAAGTPLRFSGSRPWDVHGPFCQIFRGVLQLVAGDAASPCFKLSDALQVDGLGARTGWAEPGGFVIDHSGVQTLRQKLLRQAAVCRLCFNQYHCARGCPDVCGLEARPGQPETEPAPPAFRCQVQMRLSSAAVERAAAGLAVSAASPLASALITMDT